MTTTIIAINPVSVSNDTKFLGIFFPITPGHGEVRSVSSWMHLDELCNTYGVHSKSIPWDQDVLDQAVEALDLVPN